LTPGSAGHQNRIEQAEIEIDNLRAAFAWSHENSDVVLALQLASSLQPLWLTRGRIREGLAWFDRSLTAGSADHLDVPPTVRHGHCRQGGSRRLDRGSDNSISRTGCEGRVEPRQPFPDPTAGQPQRLKRGGELQRQHDIGVS